VRDLWEAAMFGGAYQRPGVRPADRPVYGALDLLGHADGPAPRFGSCRLRMRPHVLARTTLSVGDSYGEPADRGTADAPAPVVAGLLEEVAAGRLHLGAPELGPRDVAGLLLSASAGPSRTERLGRAMDEYLEAQVHGPVRPAEDADELVADPSFRGTAVGQNLVALAERCGLELRWHPGFALPVDEVPAWPRGPVMPVLAQRLRDLTGAGVLTAAVIGQDALSVVREPATWAELGTPAECLQHLKLLWHVLVIAGRLSAEL
jgi:GNAT superfamily N-acetyltransferase